MKTPLAAITALALSLSLAPAAPWPTAACPMATGPQRGRWGSF